MIWCRERVLSRATQVLALLAFCAALRYVGWRWRRVIDTSYWVRYVQRGAGNVFRFPSAQAVSPSPSYFVCLLPKHLWPSMSDFVAFQNLHYAV